MSITSTDMAEAFLASERKETTANEATRTFETGAKRDTDEGKFDYEGFLSPAVIRRFGGYMHRHRKMADGSMRDSDNWQKGIPQDQYMKSLLRHVIDLWALHRGDDASFELASIDDPFGETLCAIMFNAMGYLHEHLKEN